MVYRALYHAEPPCQAWPQLLQVLGGMVAVGDEVIRRADAAGHDYTQVMVQGWHRRLWIAHKGQVVNGQQLPFGADRNQYEVGRVEQIDAAAGQPFDTGKREVEPVPDAREVAFRNPGKRMQGEGEGGPLAGGDCS